MKVILFQNIAGVGQKYDVKEVKPGYWRNFLFPNNLAKEATQEALKQLEIRRQKELGRKKIREEKILEAAKELSEKKLIMEAKADEKGNLFAGIKADKIAKFLKENLNLDIDENLIKLKKPIKQVGSYEIQVGGANFKLEVRIQQ